MAPPPSLACTLPAPPRGWHRLAVSPLADGRLAVLLADHDFGPEFVQADTGGFKGDPFAAAKRAKGEIWLFDGEQWACETCFDLLTPFPKFDRCPDGRWLVVSSRRWSDKDDARLIDPQGRVTGTLRLGDGIEHVQVDPHGIVWCGWFDEGVFGNSGWAYPGREWPPSCAGLAAFDLEGTCLAEAPPCAVNLGIADCYALNATREAAWACTYSGFPLLNMQQPGSARYYLTELSGTRALAVHGEHVVTIGSYDRDRVPFTLFALRGDAAQVIGHGDLMISRDKAKHLPDLYGRGPWLHCVEDGQWQRWHIDQFVTATE